MDVRFLALVQVEGEMNGNGFSSVETEYIRKHHNKQQPGENQCGSALVKHIKAPVHLVYIYNPLPLYFLLIVHLDIRICVRLLLFNLVLYLCALD